MLWPGGSDKASSVNETLLIRPIVPNLRLPAEVLQGFRQPVDALLDVRYRRLVARSKRPHVVVTAIARELNAFMWAIARTMPTHG